MSSSQGEENKTEMQIKGAKQRDNKSLLGQWGITRVTWGNYGGFTSCSPHFSPSWQTEQARQDIKEQLCKSKRLDMCCTGLQRLDIVWVCDDRGDVESFLLDELGSIILLPIFPQRHLRHARPWGWWEAQTQQVFAPNDESWQQIVWQKDR